MFTIFFGGCLLSGCADSSLSSFTEFINEDFSALAHLDIERSDLETERSVGQQLVVTWRLPARIRHILPLSLYVWVYYGNGTLEKLIYDVHNLSGFRVYRLLGCDYEEKQGIVSYKISLCDGETIILNRQHHLWMEVIPLQNS